MNRKRRRPQFPNKDGLLGSLNAVINNFMYGLLASRLAAQADLDRYEDTGLRFHTLHGKDVSIHPREFIRYLRTERNRTQQIGEFEIALMRMLVRETYEAVFWYSRVTGQETVLKPAPWYSFAKLMRHITSHERGGFLNEWGRSLSNVTSVSWRGHVLQKSMLGQPVKFTLGDGLQLWRDIHDFAATHLG